MGNSPSINNIEKSGDKFIFKRTDNSTAGEFYNVGIKSAKVDEKGNLFLTKTDESVDGPFFVRGPPGNGIESAVIDKSGNLIFTRTDSSNIGPFNVKGDQGIQGIQGIQGFEGKPGPQGIKGDKGDIGPVGSRGVSISSVNIDTLGFLVVTTTDGKSAKYNVKPVDGKNGVSVRDAYVNKTNQLVLKLSDGTETQPLNITGPKGDPGVGIDRLEYDDSGFLNIFTTDGRSSKYGVKPNDGKDGVGILSVEIDETGLMNISTTDGKYAKFNVKPKDGIQGLQGDKGDKGDTGLQGDKGDTGPQGLQGIKGDKGDTGLQGDKGDKGDTGPQGLQGIKGDTGPQGLYGSQGIPGIKGETGTGISSTFIDNTGKLVITYSNGDKSASLDVRGPQGIQGVKGETGSQGIQGERGFTGIQGIQGIQGLKGEIGSQGIPGLKGETGIGISSTVIDNTGKLVITYTNGTKSASLDVRGPTGANGAQGPRGATGDQGYPGATGAQGPRGATGDQGPPGTVSNVTGNFQTSKINFTSKWTGSPDGVRDVSEISNDTTGYNTLMIVGNKSAGAERRVGIWDRLDVNGKLCVQGVCIDGATLASFIKNNDKITLRSNRGGLPESRVQRSDDNVMRFANNNRGEHETLSIERL